MAVALTITSAFVLLLIPNMETTIRKGMSVVPQQMYEGGSPGKHPLSSKVSHSKVLRRASGHEVTQAGQSASE